MVKASESHWRGAGGGCGYVAGGRRLPTGKAMLSRQAGRRWHMSSSASAATGHPGHCCAAVEPADPADAAYLGLGSSLAPGGTVVVGCGGAGNSLVSERNFGATSSSASGGGGRGVSGGPGYANDWREQVRRVAEGGRRCYRAYGYGAAAVARAAGTAPAPAARRQADARHGRLQIPGLASCRLA
jgi:hypothetical protein